MKTLIIPDIHTRWQKADSIVKKYEKQVDEIVLLGDYFDDFDDSPKINKRTAEWLIEFTSKENHIALLGNHELNYLYNKKLCICSGFSNNKNTIINKTMDKTHWGKLRPLYYTQDWLLTHAGVHPDIGEHPVLGWNKEKFEETVRIELEAAIEINIIANTLRVGMARGGAYLCGGYLWCDYNVEFEPIQGLKQVFGHTPLKEPKRYKDTDNWCIDTHLNHIAIIENGTLSTLKI